MKKHKIVILLGALVFGFILVTSTVSASSLDSKTKELEENKKQAVIASKIEEEVKKENYPSYFGGVYISDDSSHVVIQIVKDKIPLTTNSKEFSTFNKISNIDSNVQIEYVKNSYQELNDINNKLIEYFSSEKADVSNLSAHYVDVFNNVIVVELKDNSKEQQDKFKKEVIDSNLITFVQGENFDHN